MRDSCAVSAAIWTAAGAKEADMEHQAYKSVNKSVPKKDAMQLLTGKPVETGILHYTDLFYEEYTQIPMK